MILASSDKSGQPGLTDYMLLKAANKPPKVTAIPIQKASVSNKQSEVMSVITCLTLLNSECCGN